MATQVAEDDDMDLNDREMMTWVWMIGLKQLIKEVEEEVETVERMKVWDTE